ncbi:CAAX protease [Pseudomonas capsici]|uniref:CAAX protease n=1 Tax=Pseudomonas capsici TaxID=2810614 RepID=A0ABT3BWN0_9PSED|nr:CAAX protease [Pseudomonas capsici]MBN6714785.1 CAAX protease [Pseudomonas capsici]MBN6719856.1 CAAX protease [Pseudomonas capsici]MBN6724306.1 CAAX protease [Pseudomonas capsici]MCV4261971.1 CAAX protease [Pseudomonas capsici]MCV4268511.1 CAAX protease [Pseudomonas capsici]
MPHNIQYRPLLIDELISSHRIASYSKVFSTQNDAELVGAYLWNSHVCAALYPLLSAAEVTLRNSIDTALTADLGKFWWRKGTLRYKSFTLGTTKAPYPVEFLAGNFLSAFKAAQKERSKRTGKPFKGTPDHHEIVSKTDFSTWEFILENEYMGNNLIWPKNLGTVFRGTWPTSSAANMLAQCKDRVSLVRNFRNRVFHHEPAWKRFGVTNEQQAVVHLHEKIGKINELISWISPEKIDLLEKSGVIRTAYRACSVAEIARFKYQSKTSTVNSMAKLIKIAEAASVGNEVVKIAVYGKRKAIYTMQPA